MEMKEIRLTDVLDSNSPKESSENTLTSFFLQAHRNQHIISGMPSKDFFSQTKQRNKK